MRGFRALRSNPSPHPMRRWNRQHRGYVTSACKYARRKMGAGFLIGFNDTHPPTLQKTLVNAISPNVHFCDDPSINSQCSERGI